MFELHVSDNDVTNGTITVGWCVSKEDLEKLAVNDPVVVLIVAPEHYHHSREHRIVVPLKDLIAYVSFRFPGKNRIFGFLSSLSVSSTKSAYLSKYAGVYITNVLSSNGIDYNGMRIDMYAISYAEPIVVDVPVECFAPEPSKIEKAWVNWLFESQCVDQCHFRKRRIFAYTVGSLVMILNLLVRSIFILIAALVASKNLSLNYLFHPLTEFPECIEVIDTPILLNQNQRGWRRYWKLIFMPISLLLITLITYLFIHFHATVFPVAGYFIGIAIFIASICSVVKYYIDRPERFKDETISEPLPGTSARRATPPPPWYLKEEELKHIVCKPGSKKPLSIKELPAKKRTFRLRFAAIKSKVCRPFAN